MRHDLATVNQTLPKAMLLASRETLRDVGTEISVESETCRLSPRSVVEVNCKRLQETLRSLEEFGKLHRLNLGQQLERLRYRAYTIERSIFLCADARRYLQDVHLCVLVTGSQCAAALDWTVQEAIAGGAA